MEVLVCPRQQNQRKHTVFSARRIRRSPKARLPRRVRFSGLAAFSTEPNVRSCPSRRCLTCHAGLAFFFGRSGLRREKSGKVREKADHFQTRSGCDARLQLPEGQQACKAGWGCDAAIWTYLATLHRQAWSPAHTVGIRLGQIWTFQEYVDLGKEILEYVPELQPEYPRNPKKSDLRNQIPSAKQIRNKRSSKPGKQLLLNWLSRAWSTLERSEQLGTEKFWLLLGNSLACMTCRNWPLLFVCAWHLDSLRILPLAIFFVTNCCCLAHAPRL